MKIAVTGLWHLGCVTAACLAEAGHDVIAYDAECETIAKLQSNQAPVSEPGLDDLIKKGQSAGKLHFTMARADLSAADIVWVTFDTPVDEEDIADVEAVKSEICAFLPYLKENTLVIISSQLPVGSTRALQHYSAQQFPHKHISFAASPENLRLGKAIQIFLQPDRIVVGIEGNENKNKIEKLLQPITNHIVWMSIESAEMTKHAINAFLATSV